MFNCAPNIHCDFAEVAIEFSFCRQQCVTERLNDGIMARYTRKFMQSGVFIRQDVSLTQVPNKSAVFISISENVADTT